MRVSGVKIVCCLFILCAVLNLLEAKKSKRSEKDNIKIKPKSDKGRDRKPGKLPIYTEPVEIIEKTELESDNAQQNGPETNITQSTVSDDHSKDSDESEDTDDKKKKKTKPFRPTQKPTVRTTVRPTLRTTIVNVLANGTTSNWTTSAAAINTTAPVNSSRHEVTYGRGHGQHHHRPDTDGHRTDGHMPCAMGPTKLEKVERDITALWGYVQGISQPLHLHVYNEDGDMKVDRSPRGHSEIKHSKQRKEREEKGKIDKDDKSKKGIRANVKGPHRHLSHKHSRHTHNDRSHSHHDHSKHNHSHHGHTDHQHSKHNHSHHGHTDHHHSKHPGHVLGHLSLSKLGKGRETHIHIHIHVDDKGDKQNKGDDHHKDEKDKSEHDEKPLYATCDLRNHDPKHNISGTISLRQKPGQQLEVRIQVHGFSVPLTTDELRPDTWPLNSSAVVYNETDSLLPVVSQHGFHVHEYGDFSQGCVSFGGHFNPEGVTHGHRNGGNVGHVGDWGNIDVDANGNALSYFEVKSASLRGQNSIIGRGIVIHARADDLGEGHTKDSKTTGDAGGRIACCTVAWTKPQ